MFSRSKPSSNKSRLFNKSTQVHSEETLQDNDGDSDDDDKKHQHTTPQHKKQQQSQKKRSIIQGTTRNTRQEEYVSPTSLTVLNPDNQVRVSRESANKSTQPKQKKKTVVVDTSELILENFIESLGSNKPDPFIETLNLSPAATIQLDSTEERASITTIDSNVSSDEDDDKTKRRQLKEKWELEEYDRRWDVVYNKYNNNFEKVQLEKGSQNTMESVTSFSKTPQSSHMVGHSIYQSFDKQPHNHHRPTQVQKPSIVFGSPCQEEDEEEGSLIF